MEGPAEDTVGGGAEGARVVEEPVQGTGPPSGREVWPVLDFLSTTDVGRWVPAEEEDAVSAVSEPEVREWLDEQGEGAEASDTGGAPMFLPTPGFMASAGTA